MTDHTNTAAEALRDEEVQYDEVEGAESTSRKTRYWRVVNVLAGLFTLYALAAMSGIFGQLGWLPSAVQQRAILLSVALLVVYLTVPFSKKSPNVLRSYDVIFLVMGLFGSAFVAVFYDTRIIEYGYFGYLDFLGVLAAIGLSISLLEALRRLIGPVLPILIILILASTYWQNVLPGLLNGMGFDLPRLTYAVYVGSGGIFGVPFGIAVEIIIVFLVFGALLQTSGGGKWFMDIANALTGASRGGPAKTAVVASAFMGSISGSPSGNTATTGAMTIPLMKKTGYNKNFAGAVEAVASTGGMILPPVMGAVAFIMAEMLSISYADVVIAALVPALLYYVILFFSVHFKAARDGLDGLPRASLPPFWSSLVAGWRFLLPIGVLTYALVGLRLDPGLSGIYAIVTLILCSFATKNREEWLTPRRIWSGLVEAAYGWRLIGMVTASVGLMVGALNLSGLGVKISSFILELGAGNLVLTLLLIGVASLILGMGMEIIPLYLTLIVLTAPALIDMGLDPIQAHLYVVFWGLASFITPPVCNAVFVACTISGGTIWRTGGNAMLLGSALFLVSFALGLNSSLILQGSLNEIVVAVGTALAGSIVLAASFQGYGLWRMNFLQRIAGIAAGGFLLLGQSVEAYLTALAILVVLFVWWRLPLQGNRDKEQKDAQVQQQVIHPKASLNLTTGS